MKIAFLSLLCVLALESSTPVQAFVPSSAVTSSVSSRSTVQFSTAASEESTTATTTDNNAKDDIPPPPAPIMPLSWEEMVRQVAATVAYAEEHKGMTRQVVRILLPRDRTNDEFGKYQESEMRTSNGDNNNENSNNADWVLVPPDESWQGGIMQLYRSAAPVAQALLQQLQSKATVPSRISEDRSVDESGVDGVGLVSTEDQAWNVWVQPTQESVDAIEERLTKASATTTTTTVIMNPQWRQVDDVLDAQSQTDGFWGSVANFLGGKGSTLARLKEADFQATYTLEGYVCRGANVRILQILPDAVWTVYCQRDNGESYVAIGTSPAAAGRPTYQQVEDMLTESGIGYKYARDMGWQDKL